MPTADNFELKEIDLPPARRRHGSRRQPLAVGRSLHARADERREKLCPAVRARRADGGRRGRRGGREQRRRLRARRPRAAHGRLARRGGAAGPRLNKLPDLGVEPQAFLGNLGLTGATAYFGLLDAASAKEGDIVFVSAAAGAVGSAVVQIAKAKGMTVIGSAGGADKCDFVRSLGADEVDRLQGRPDPQRPRRSRAPDGIDVYFDNVGGDHLDAALALARKNARFAICGMIEGYNKAEPTSCATSCGSSPRASASRASSTPIICRGWANSTATWARWIASGAVKSRDTVVEGLDNDARRVPRPVQGRQHRQDAGPALELAGCAGRPTCRPRAERRHALRRGAVGEAVGHDLPCAASAACRRRSLRRRACPSSMSPGSRIDPARRGRWPPTRRHSNRPEARPPTWTALPSVSLGARLELVRLVERAFEVLDMVADLMGDDIGHGEIAGRPEALRQLVEEARVDVDLACRSGSRTGPSPPAPRRSRTGWRRCKRPASSAGIALPLLGENLAPGLLGRAEHADQEVA